MTRAIVLALLAGCLYETTSGSGPPHESSNHDAAIATHDATIDAIIPMELTYTEQHDLTNDFNHAEIEATNLAYSPATVLAISISGVIDTGSAHYDPAYGTIDVDNYGVVFDDEGQIIVGLNGDSLASIPAIELQLYSDQIGSVIGSAAWSATSSSIDVYVPPGAYEIGMFASGSAGDAAVTGPPIPYTIVIQPDLELD
jgi:hypothetical protein